MTNKNIIQAIKNTAAKFGQDRIDAMAPFAAEYDAGNLSAIPANIVADIEAFKAGNMEELLALLGSDR